MRANCPEDHKARRGTAAECGDCPLRQQRRTIEAEAEGKAVVQDARERALARREQAVQDAQPTAEVATREAHSPGLITDEMREQAASIIEVALARAEEVLTRHVQFPSRAALDRQLMWLVHSNARERGAQGMPGPLIWEATPRYAIISKRNQSAKSTDLELMARIGGSRLGRLSSITAPGYARLMSSFNEPAMIDDAGNLFGRGAGHILLQQHILNGYTQGAVTFDARKGGTILNLFGVAAYAGRDELITANMSGSLTDLLSRSLILRLDRANRFYPDIDSEARQWCGTIHNLMLNWAYVMGPDLRRAAWELGQEAVQAGQLAQSDVDAGILRQVQLNRPLLACARVIGGDWPDRMLEAASTGSELKDLLAEADGLTALPGNPSEVTFTDDAK